MWHHNKIMMLDQIGLDHGDPFTEVDSPLKGDEKIRVGISIHFINNSFLLLSTFRSLLRVLGSYIYVFLVYIREHNLFLFEILES